MNQEPRFQQLLESARRAPVSAEEASMPYGFDTRVLVQWASAEGDESPLMTALPVLRRGIVVGAAVMLLSLAWGYVAWSHSDSDADVGIAESALALNLPESTAP
jgi:hypothetical protein